MLDPVKGVHAYFYKSYDGTRITLELGNIQLLPIEVLALSYNNDLLAFPVLKETILLPKIPSRLVDYQLVSFPFPKSLAWSDEMICDLKVKYRLLGTTQIRYETIFPYSHLSDDFIKKDLVRQPPNAGSFEFLKVDEATKRILIKPGNWNLTRNLIIPEGYKVVCIEGTQVNISNSAKILSYSPLEFLGSEHYPIVIRSVDLTGQGIVVMNAGRSRLKYVRFINLSSPSQGRWELTGAVTFYESPVEIDQCQFLNSRSEDALNIVRSEFSIDGSLFDKSSFDAIDTDFSEGKITNTSFMDCGDDAIDVCGSIVELANIFINGVGDKGLSVGEDSKVNVRTVEIKNAGIAAASKDLSELNINNATISNCEIGLAAYQKKAEFAPASITVTGLAMDNVDTLYLVEEKSRLEIEGERIESNTDDERKFIKGNEDG